MEEPSSWLKSIDPGVITTYAVEYGTALIMAAVIFILGRWVARMVTRMVKLAMGRAKLDATLVSFLGNLVYGLLLAFVVIAALSQLGVETTSLAAIFAAAGLAIGLALQGSLANFAAGVLLIAFRPFKVGDFVEMAGTAGVVEEVNIFTTHLRTGDNKAIIVPNAAVTGGIITNYSAKDTRRVDMVFGIGYDDDIKAAKELLTRLVEADERILKDPAPTIAVAELGESSVDFVVRPWVKAADYWAVKFDLTETVKQEFDSAGISIPYPQRDVHVREAKAQAA